MENSFLRYLSLILLFITIAADEELVPNYDIPEHEMKIFNYKHPIVLNCNITSGAEGKELTWEKGGVDVGLIDRLKNPDNAKIYKDEQKFIIQKAEYEDAGIYSCVLKDKNLRRNFTVVAHPYVNLPANTGVVEGEKLSIYCNAFGTDIDIVWIIGNNLTIKETTGRYIIKDENNLKSVRLEIENVVPEDRGEYTCNVTNNALAYQNKQPVSDTTLVRVKGKLAALWPFLGICAEVFILCGIILIYEKRRNKTELDESDTDPNTEQEKLKVQRK
uniref:Putative neuroplastin-like protein n=1 Tax=Tabanus bromius TaxID=304241 RepID=A0A0K8TR25_TABBR